ncbi:MAG: hypothetical protein H7A03_00115 [Pseudomonadales bacterium]|nr:hypothetical protein [Pseudomonadales bacterium]
MQKPALNFVLGSLFGSLIVFTLYNTLLIEHTTVTYLPDGGKYTGEKMGELLHGTGYIEWPEGSSYKGTFRNGTMEGKGVLHTSDGSVYEGEFKGGIPNGHGTYKFNGYTYTGEFQRNLFHGQGSTPWPMMIAMRVSLKMAFTMAKVITLPRKKEGIQANL